MTHNFTASFLKFMDKEILDDLGNSISTIAYKNKQYPLKFNPPTIVYDYLEAEETKQSQIKEIKGIKAIEKLGFSLCTIIPPKEFGWKQSRQRQVVLLKIGSPEEKYAKKLATTQDCKILFDEANLKIKLISRRASPLGESAWIEIK
jgi:hypothetical protein